MISELEELRNIKTETQNYILSLIKFNEENDDYRIGNHIITNYNENSIKQLELEKLDFIDNIEIQLETFL